MYNVKFQSLWFLICAILPIANGYSGDSVPRVSISEIRSITVDERFYSAWGTVIRRANGELMLAYSGGREDHICPFGRVESMVSRDEGRTWTWPRVLMDSASDDRDTGLLETSKGTLLVTFFTSIAYQQHLEAPTLRINRVFKEEASAHIARSKLAKLRLSPEEQAMDVGNWMLRSTDGGLNWSARLPMPCFSPHGPTEMLDGGLMFAGANGPKSGVWISRDDGLTWVLLSYLDVRPGETHGIEANDGTLVVHVRDRVALTPGGSVEWATVQMDSENGGKTWSKPRIITDGYPSFIKKLANGSILMTYGYRKKPYGVRARVSLDNAKTWSEEIVISSDGNSSDLGYPSTVQLSDNSLLTVWYEVVKGSRNAILRQAKWTIY